MAHHSALIVASEFPPLKSAGIHRTLRIVKYLPEQGWELGVLTLRTDSLPDLMQPPNSPTPVAAIESCPVYRAPARFPIEKMNQLIGRNKKTGRSKTTPPPPASNGAEAVDAASQSKRDSRGTLQRFKDRITSRWQTPDRLIGWVKPATKLGLTAIGEKNADVIYSSGPPWSNHLVAGNLSRASGLPWVADFRDPWVGNAFRPDRSGDTWAGRKHRTLEEAVYRNASMVIFNTEPALQDAISRIGNGLSGKSLVIPNGFDPADFKDLEIPEKETGTRSTDRTGPLRMLHTGTFYGKRNVDSLLAVIRDLKQSGQLTSADFQLDLIGKSRSHEVRLIEDYSIADLVKLTPPVPHGECLVELKNAGVLLLIQTEAPLCVPGKLYEYIATGRPILTIAGMGATAELVQREQLGPCVEPEDRQQLKYIVLNLVEKHKSGQVELPNKCIRDRFDGQLQMQVFDEVFRRAIVSS